MMQAGDLKQLAGTADLAKLDIASTRLFLWSNDKVVLAYYNSAYSAGCRHVPRPVDFPDLSCEVDAATFSTAVGLFGDAEQVQVDRSGNDLRLRSKAHQVKVRSYPVDEGREIQAPEAVPIARVPLPGLLREAELAAGFVATSIARPALTGISLNTGAVPGRLTITAFNGDALYSSSLPLPENGEYEPAAIIIPPLDLVLGLKLLAGDEVVLSVSGEGDGLELLGKNGWFHGSVLTDQWPDLTGHIATVPASLVTLRADQLKAMAQSVRAFDAATDIQLLGTPRGILLQTLSAEAGQYVTRLEGTYSGTTYYNIGDLILAAGLGDTLRCHVAADNGKPTRIEAGERRVWVSTKKLA